MYHVGAALQIFCQSVSIWMVLNTIGFVLKFYSLRSWWFFLGGGRGWEEKRLQKRARTSNGVAAPLHCSFARSTEEPQTTQAKDFKVRLTYRFSPKHCQGVKGLIQPVNCNELLVPPGFTEIYKYRTAILFKTKYYIAGKKRPAWDYKGRLEDMEAFLLKSNSCMEDMTKTIGDNQGRIGYLESLNKQLEGTVQVKNQQSEQVRSASIAIPRSGRGSRSLPIPHSRFLCTTSPLPELLSSLSRIPLSFPIPPTVPKFWRIKLPEKRPNSVSRQKNFAFSRIPHYILVTGL